MPLPTPANHKTVTPPGIAAIVNGKKIFRYQVANEALKAIGPQLVNQMILIELINQEAAKQGVVVTKAQVASRLADIEKQYDERGAPGGLQALLAQRRQTLEAYTTQLQTEIIVGDLVAKTLPPGTSTLKFHARHLLILTTRLGSAAVPGAPLPHTDAAALALIAKAQAELKAGKSFTDVANQYTEDPSGKGKGGDLGILDASTPFDPAFLKAALALKPGEVTQLPVKSMYGYHLIKIDSSSAAPLPADQALYATAAENARRQQIQQAIPGYVQKLRSSAQIVDYLTDPAPPASAFPPQSGVPQIFGTTR